MTDALQAVEIIELADASGLLPFEWPATPKEAQAHPAEAPPIVGHL